MEKWQGLWNVKINLTFVVLFSMCIAFWLASWIFGLFLTTIFTIIGAAMVGLWIRLTGRG